MSKLYTHGFHVSIPYAGSTPYDLLAEKNGQILRIQVKLISKRSDERLDRVRTTRGIARAQTYSTDHIDWLIAVSLKRSLCYVFPINFIANRKSITVSYGEKKSKAETYLEAWHKLG